MPELLDLACSIAARALAGDGEQVEAYVSQGRETSVRVYEGEVESLSTADSAGVGVRVVRDARMGFAWVGALGETAAAEALREARDNARYSSVDEHAGLAVPDGIEPAPLELWREELGRTPTEAKIDLVLGLERRVRHSDRRIRQVVKTDYADGMRESAIATSTGICATSRRSNCFISSYAIAGEGEESRTGFGYSVGRSVGDLDVAKAAGDATDRATRLLGAKKPPSSRLTVLLEPRVTATLLSILAATLSGEEVAKGRSLFAGRRGEEVGVASLTLVDDPTEAASYGATPTDAEGLACRRNRLIDAGKLVGYLYDTRAGRLAGTASTASAVRGGYRTTPRVGARAVSVEPGDLDQDEIVRRIDRGVLVQSVTGVHSGVNAVSGDFSVGAEGLMIRDGALAEPVRELTIASTIQRMLQHIVHIGSDVEQLPGSATGVSLAITDVSVSGA